MRDEAKGNIPPIGYYKGVRLLKIKKLETMQLRKRYIYEYLP